MEVITFESETFKALENKLNVIANFVLSLNPPKDENEIWVDSYEVCTFLKISERTLQRIRTKGEVEFSTIRGKHYYKVGEIKRLLESRVIKRSSEHIEDLINNHKLHVQERRDIK